MLELRAQRGSLYTPCGLRKYLTAAERDRFMRAAQDCGRNELSTLCLTMAYTGCRISEALALNVASIERDAGFIAVRSLKKRDGAVVVREIPVLAVLLIALGEIHDLAHAHPQRRLWSLSRSQGWRLIKVVMERAGISAGPHMTARSGRSASRGIAGRFDAGSWICNLSDVTVTAARQSAVLKPTMAWASSPVVSVDHDPQVVERFAVPQEFNRPTPAVGVRRASLGLGRMAAMRDYPGEIENDIDMPDSYVLACHRAKRVSMFGSWPASMVAMNAARASWNAVWNSLVSGVRPAWTAPPRAS